MTNDDQFQSGRPVVLRNGIVLTMDDGPRVLHNCRTSSRAGLRAMHENGFITPRNVYVHAASLSDDYYQRIAATGGSVSVSTESEQSAGQGYPPTWRLRRHGIPVSLSMDTSVWWSGDLFSAMRATLSADRSREAR